MNVKQSLQSLIQQVETGSIADLKSALKSIDQIPTQILQSYLPSVNSQISQLMQAFDRNIRANSEYLTSPENFQSLRRQFMRTIDHVPARVKRQFMSALGVAERLHRQMAFSQVLTVQNQQKAIQQQAMITTAVQKGQAVTIAPLIAETQKSPIQRSVEQYQPIFTTQPISQITPDQLPPAMKLLSRYAQLKKAQPVGSVTNQSGSAYVGVMTIDNGSGMKQLVPFQAGKINNSKTPSIAAKLDYHAVKTIESWNNYVKQQANFLRFYRKINTPQARLQYVTKQFKGMNKQTFSAQVLATLVHYYIYIPLVKFNKAMASNMKIQSSYKDFLVNYSPGTTPKDNPLMLSSNQLQKIIVTMFDSKLTPDALLTTILPLIYSFKNKLNEKATTTIMKYVETRTAQAQTYLRQNGINQTLAAQVLASNDWSSVRKRKFIFQNSTMNVQAATIARGIIKKPQNKTQPFQFSWGQSEIWSNDYVWRQSM